MNDNKSLAHTPCSIGIVFIPVKQGTFDYLTP